MTVAIHDNQERAGAPAGSFASGAVGAILGDMTATLTSPNFVGRTEELTRLAAAGDRAAGGTPTAVLSAASRSAEPAVARGGRGPPRRGAAAGLCRAGRWRESPRPPGRVPGGWCATGTSRPGPAAPGPDQAELAHSSRAGPPAARVAGGSSGANPASGRQGRLFDCSGLLNGWGPAPTCWWRDGTGPTARPRLWPSW